MEGRFSIVQDYIHRNAPIIQFLILHVSAVVQCTRGKDNESACFIFHLVVFKKKLASVSCIPYGIKETKDGPSGFVFRVDMKFGFGQARLCANMNSLYIWWENKVIVFRGECSNSEHYAPEIAAQKIYMNLASCLNMQPREAEKRHAKTFTGP
jgi:hypothetical protein